MGKQVVVSVVGMLSLIAGVAFGLDGDTGTSAIRGLHAERISEIFKAIDANPAMSQEDFYKKLAPIPGSLQGDITSYYKQAHLAAVSPLHKGDPIVADAYYFGDVVSVDPDGRNARVALCSYPGKTYTYSRARLAKEVVKYGSFQQGSLVEKARFARSPSVGKITNLYEDGMAGVEYTGSQGTIYLVSTTKLKLREFPGVLRRALRPMTDAEHNRILQHVPVMPMRQY